MSLSKEILDELDKIFGSLERNLAGLKSPNDFVKIAEPYFQKAVAAVSKEKLPEKETRAAYAEIIRRGVFITPEQCNFLPVVAWRMKINVFQVAFFSKEIIKNFLTEAEMSHSAIMVIINEENGKEFLTDVGIIEDYVGIIED
ncbi:MAG: hypothetical protein AAB851_03805 [Patescibacteria group bacterium]